MSKLVLIDGHAILHRAYHALPPLTTKNGEPINAVYGFVSMLLRVITDLKPTHIAVCFDRPEPTFRREKFDEYQKQRPEMDKELSSQIDKVQKVVEAFGIPSYSLAGYEADDLIGTIARQAVESERVKKWKSRSENKTHALQLSRSPALINEVFIVTGDRDILQLVNDKVKVYLPIKGLSEAKLFGPEEVKEKMGVRPELIPDYKGLVGDPSDNYPGVPGIGPKTAINLIDKYGSVAGVFENLDKISQTTADKLKAGRTSGLMSHELATIVTNVPVSFDFDKASAWKVDSAKVLSLFKEFGFRTLTERVKKVGKQIASEKQMSLI